jgi:hypothetical protein
MCLKRYWHLYDRGLSPEEVDANFAFDFHGDDSVDGATPLYAKWTEVEEFNDWAKTRGMSVRLKTEHTGAIHEVEYLSQHSVKRDGMWLPVHKTPAKLLASAALKAPSELPSCSHGPECPGWSRYSYHLARLAGIATELWPDPRVYEVISNVYERYKATYDDSLKNDVHWNEAQHIFLGDVALSRLWMDPEPVGSR